ncbi:MAG TPA: extracellular solute-binding protein [Alphaproteobacteria bacterium]|nr:extracellular solute-binding protein [Alphaproteobacteria bacterium]
MRNGMPRIGWIGVIILAMMLGLGPMVVDKAEAAKPFEGTTVKVIVNAEYVKYALTLIEKELMDTHGIKLEVEVIPGEAFVTKTLLEFTGGRSPWDLIMFNPTFFADYHRHFEPLEPFVKKLNLKLDLDDIAKEYQRSNMYWGDTLYAMPLDGDIHIMFYNKVAFERPENRQKFKEKYGYDLAPPQTWKQWDDQAAFFNGWGWDGSDNKLFGAGASYKENTYSFIWWRQRFFAYGGQYFDENMKPLINTKPGIRALQELVDTIQYYPPGVLLFESEEPKTMLIKGEVPLLVSWTSTGKRVGDPNQSLIIGKAGFGVMPGHQVDGKIIRTVPNTGGRSWAISKYSKVKDATAVVLAFVSSPEQSLKIVMDPKTIMDPWRNSHFTSEQFRSAFPGADEYLDAIKESFAYTVPGVMIPGGDEYQRRVAAAVSQALQKSITPKEALDQAAEDWDKITKRRGLKRQQELWRQQMASMKETGVTFRPELADK